MTSCSKAQTTTLPDGRSLMSTFSSFVRDAVVEQIKSFVRDAVVEQITEKNGDTVAVGSVRDGARDAIEGPGQIDTRDQLRIQDDTAVVGRGRTTGESIGSGIPFFAISGVR